MRGEGSLHRIDLDGGGDELFLEDADERSKNPYRSASVSPDGRLLAVPFQIGSEIETYDVFLVHLESGRLISVEEFYKDPNDDYDDRFPVWSPDSQTLFWSHRTYHGWERKESVVRRKRLADRRSPLSHDGDIVPQPGLELALGGHSPAGRALAYADASGVAPGQLWVWDLDHEQAVLVYSGASQLHVSDWGVPRSP